MVPPSGGIEEVAVIRGTVIFVVLVPAVGPGQGQGSLPPGSPVRWGDWPAGLSLWMLIFICFRVRAIHHLYGDLKDWEQSRVNKELPVSKQSDLQKTVGENREYDRCIQHEGKSVLHGDTEWKASRNGQHEHHNYTWLMLGGLRVKIDNSSWKPQFSGQLCC